MYNQITAEANEVSPLPHATNKGRWGNGLCPEASWNPSNGDPTSGDQH